MTWQDTLIKGMIEIESAKQTQIAEIKTPNKALEQKYTPLERKIVEMLTENTGIHMLDSGGAYGRAWQKNRSRNFKKEPSTKIDCYEYEDGTVEVNIYYNVFHYLVNFLAMTPESERLQKQFEAFCESEEYKDAYWLACMEGFIEQFDDNYGITNTYNYENIISQVLQYGIFEVNDIHYIILQIHNGCDVRGGYTKPYIFELDDFDYFQIAQSDIFVRCKKCGMSWTSDDSGYHWYYDGNYSDNGSLDDSKDTELKIKVKNDKPFHKNCDGKLDFSVMEDY
jgi:hypothetical protein